MKPHNHYSPRLVKFTRAATQAIAAPRSASARLFIHGTCLRHVPPPYPAPPHPILTLSGAATLPQLLLSLRPLRSVLRTGSLSQSLMSHDKMRHNNKRRNM